MEISSLQRKPLIQTKRDGAESASERAVEIGQYLTFLLQTVYITSMSHFNH